VASLALRFFPQDRLRLTDGEHLQLLVGAGAILLLGIYDDIRGASALLKLAVQVAATSMLFYYGVRIGQISTPFGLTIHLGVLDFPLTLLWVVGLTNAINLLDGIDGLAAGVGALGALSLAVLSVWQGSIEVALIAASLGGSLIGFLFFNFHPATIFLGDCGALTLGFLLAEIPILSGQKSATAVALFVPIVALGIPILDTSMAILRRATQRKHLFQADRAHLHHRLLALGLSQSQVAFTLYIVSGILSLMAIAMTNASRMGALLILFFLGTGTVIAMRRLGMDEVKTLWGAIRYGERRSRPPRYRSLLVRNSVSALEQCKTWADLEVVLDDVRRGLDLDYLRVLFKDEVSLSLLSGASDLTFVNPNLPFNLHNKLSWSLSVDIDCAMRSGERTPRNGKCQKVTACGMESRECERGGGRVIGEIFVRKPIWKLRRASEKDTELVQMFADGLGRFFAGRTLTDQSVPVASVLVAEQSEGTQVVGRNRLRDGAKAMADCTPSTDLVLLD
jgi:UDP-GlcNAc:undecaprenyl-phosphate GlcNAc-1-phosphate transferase